MDTPRDWWTDVGTWSVLAGCSHCAWRITVGTQELAARFAEEHLIAAHPGRVRDNALDRRSVRKRRKGRA
jgi:hypothetical protein